MSAELTVFPPQVERILVDAHRQAVQVFLNVRDLEQKLKVAAEEYGGPNEWIEETIALTKEARHKVYKVQWRLDGQEIDEPEELVK